MATGIMTDLTAKVAESTLERRVNLRDKPEGPMTRSPDEGRERSFRRFEAIPPSPSGWYLLLLVICPQQNRSSIAFNRRSNLLGQSWLERRRRLFTAADLGRRKSKF